MPERLHCNVCGEDKRFSYIRTTSEVVECDANFGNEEVQNAETMERAYYKCLSCDSDDPDSVELLGEP